MFFSAKQLRFVCALSACLFAAACGQKTAPPAASAKGAPQIPVTVAKAIETSVPIEIHAIGNVEAWSTIQVKSQAAGLLVRVNFSEGQEVHKGQTLFEIDPRPYQEALNQANAAIARDQAQLQQAEANQARDQAQLNNAESQAKRYADLLKEGVVSKEQNETFSTAANTQRESIKADQATAAQARAAIDADKASLGGAKLNLEFCKIQSPIDGRTGNLAVKEGNLVKAQADTALVTINQTQPIYVTFSVPEANLSDIRRFNSRGKLAVQATIGQDTTEPNTGAEAGQLSFIDNMVNAATGSIQLKATFPNTDRRLWPGQFVNVTMRLATERNVVVVPSEAVQTGQQGQFAFVVESNGTAAIRPIKVGAAAGHNIVIENGIASGETVVTDGQMLLAPGAPVRVVKSVGAAGAP